VLRDFPKNSLCYKPDYFPYDKELDALGVFELTEASDV